MRDARRREVRVALGLLLLADAGLRLAEKVPGTFRTNYADFKAYHWAGKRVAQSRSADLFEPRDIDPDGRRVDVKPFKNVPLVAAAFVPYGRMAYPDAWRAWWLTSLAVSVAGLLALCAWTRRWCRAWVLASVFLLWASTHYYPVARAFRFGQTSQLATVLLLFAYLALERRRDVLAGSLLGIGAVLKIPLTAFGLFLLATRRWRGAAAFAGVLAASGALSIALFGFEIHREWFRVVIADNAGTVFTAMNNQSLVAQLMRVSTELPRELIRYDPVPLPGWISVAQGLASLGLVIAWSRARRRVEAPDRLALDFGFCVAILPFLYPVFWIHYFLLSLVPLAILARSAVALPGRWRIASVLLLGAAFALAAIYPDRGARYYADRGTNLAIDWMLGRHLLSSVALLCACFVIAVGTDRDASESPLS